MITLYPLQYNKYKNYYTNINFNLDETTSVLYISGLFANKYINNSITIDKNRLNLSTTVLNNSATVKYTYLLVDLFTYTYASNNITFNSIEPHKPEFLIYFDTNLNVIDSSITTQYYSHYSDTSGLSYTSLYSLTSGLSYTSIYSLTSNVTYSVAPTVIIPIENLEISPFMIPYTIFIGVYTYTPTYPTINPRDYMSFYNINTKELFVYLSNSWRRINWQKFIKSDWLYDVNRLRINTSTGGLEIVSADNNWHEIIPTVGAVFSPVGEANYIFYIAPGQTYNGYSTSKIPIIAVNELSFKGVFDIYNANEFWYGIFPSGYVINDGAGAFVAAGYSFAVSKTYVDGYYVNSMQFIPLFESASADTWANFSIHIIRGKMGTASIGYGHIDMMQAHIGHGTFPTNGYYLGYWCYEGSITYVDHISIRREY